MVHACRHVTMMSPCCHDSTIAIRRVTMLPCRHSTCRHVAIRRVAMSPCHHASVVDDAQHDGCTTSTCTSRPPLLSPTHCNPPNPTSPYLHRQPEAPRTLADVEQRPGLPLQRGCARSAIQHAFRRLREPRAAGTPPVGGAPSAVEVTCGAQAINLERETIELANASTSAIRDFTRVISDDSPRFSFFVFKR